MLEVAVQLSTVLPTQLCRCEPTVFDSELDGLPLPARL